MSRRAAAVLLAVIAALFACGGLGAGVAAAGTQPGEESVRGVLRHERQPVADVEITVSQGDREIGTATSDERGLWEVPVPGPGEYQVRIDTETLPEGVELRFEDRSTLTVQVSGSQQRAVLFALGESTRQVEGRLSRAFQLTAEGLRFGLILALGAVGLSLVFGTTGLTNFAHGELITLGALVAYLLNVTFHVPFVAAAVITVIACGFAGWLLDVGLWSRLRRGGTGLIAMMIVSIGLAILLRYLFLYLFGGSTRSYAQYAAQRGLDLGVVTFRPVDLVSMAIATVCLIAVGIALLRTRLGKATRAVADNPALAAASGIDVERIIQIVWIGGSALAALAGLLLGLVQGVNFQLGFQVLLLVFAAVTLGGLGTAFGALVGSLVVGLFIQLSTLWIPPELKNVGALAVLIVILLVRPQGILGRAERVG